MSLGYPAIAPRFDGNAVFQHQTGPFGVPEKLVTGFDQVRNGLNQCHPLENKEKKYKSNFEEMDFAMLRNMHGLHAPLRLKLERTIAGQVERLPGLHSSHLMSDTLTGRLDAIDFEDILNDPMDAELVGHPHMLMEKRLGL